MPDKHGMLEHADESGNHSNQQTSAHGGANPSQGQLLYTIHPTHNPSPCILALYAALSSLTQGIDRRRAFLSHACYQLQPNLRLLGAHVPQVKRQQLLIPHILALDCHPVSGHYPLQQLGAAGGRQLLLHGGGQGRPSQGVAARLIVHRVGGQGGRPPPVLANGQQDQGQAQEGGGYEVVICAPLHPKQQQGPLITVHTCLVEPLGAAAGERWRGSAKGKHAYQ
jgi:hypothetical protein